MSIRILVLSGLLVLSCAGFGSAAASNDTDALSQKAAAHAQSITDTTKYLASVESTLKIARQGGYGRLKGGSAKDLQAAHERMASLLKGHASGSELQPADRIALYNDQALIDSITQRLDQNRVVCKSEAEMGSRVRTNKCLTVAVREAQARAAGEAVKDLQRGYCIPSDTQPCAR